MIFIWSNKISCNGEDDYWFILEIKCSPLQGIFNNGYNMSLHIQALCVILHFS